MNTIGFFFKSFCVLAFLLPAASLTAKPKTPENVTDFKLVTAAEAKKLQGVTFVDVRKKIEYAEEHIPGAIHLPYKEKSAKKPDFDMSKDRFKHGKLKPNDKGYVFYCNGFTCWKSYKASVWAHKNGVKNIYWLRGGIPEWKKAGFPTEK